MLYFNTMYSTLCLGVIKMFSARYASVRLIELKSLSVGI